MDGSKTSLNDFALSFDTKADPELLLIMLSDEEFFADRIEKAGKEIYLNQTALDRLEELYSDKEKIRINMDDLVKFLKTDYDTVNLVIKNNKARFNNRVLIKKQGRIELATLKLEGAIFLCEEVRKLKDGREEEVKEPEKTEVKRKGKRGRKSKMEQLSMSDIMTVPQEEITVDKKDISSSEKKDDGALVSKVKDNSSSKKVLLAKEKTPKKKKSKYIAGVSYINNLKDNVCDIRTLRGFMLNLGEYKLDEIALMSDDEIRSVFLDKYIVLETANDTLIISKEAFLSIADNIYSIPKN